MLKTNIYNNFLIEKFGYSKSIYYLCKRKTRNKQHFKYFRL